MPTPQQFETDRDGNIITKPVIGWTTATLADISVLLVIQYIETPQEIETGGKSIQFVMMPQQCLELAEKLTTLAKRVLDQPPSGKPAN
jgi:hypothetical protein